MALPRGDDPTRKRILDVAASLFAERGYSATSMQAIAERLGFTKAALYHHFAGKNEILHQLLRPLLDELRAALRTAAEHHDPEVARWLAIEGFLDVSLRHRTTLRVLVTDMSLLASAPVAEEFRGLMRTANDLVCGPEASLHHRVRAAQAVACLTDPVVLFHDVAPDALRVLMLDGVRALLGASPGPAAPKRRRAGGRPTALTAEQVAQLQQLHAEGGAPEELAARFQVSRATIYRHLKNTY